MKKAYFSIALLVAVLVVLSAVEIRGSETIMNPMALAILGAGFAIASMMEHDDDMMHHSGKKKKK